MKHRVEHVPCAFQTARSVGLSSADEKKGREKSCSIHLSFICSRHLERRGQVFLGVAPLRTVLLLPALRPEKLDHAQEHKCSGQQRKERCVTQHQRRFSEEFARIITLPAPLGPAAFVQTKAFNSMRMDLRGRLP